MAPVVFVTRHLRSHQVVVLGQAAMDRFFDNRNPEDWTNPVSVNQEAWAT